MIIQCLVRCDYGNCEKTLVVAGEPSSEELDGMEWTGGDGHYCPEHRNMAAMERILYDASIGRETDEEHTCGGLYDVTCPACQEAHAPTTPVPTFSGGDYDDRDAEF